MLRFDRRVTAITDRSEAQPGASGNATEFEIVPLAGGETDTTVTDARGFETDYRLDARGRLSAMTDARGTRTELGWDNATTDDNNLIEIVEAVATDDEAVTELTYNPNGLLLSETDPNGHTTTLTYLDSAGHASHQSPRGIDTGRAFVSDLSTLTTPEGAQNGFSTTFSYDGEGRGNLRFVEDGEGHTSETRYGPFGVITHEIDEVGNPTRFEDHDANGLPRTVIDARDQIWRYCYDEVGNLTRATDPCGQAQHDCGASGRIVHSAQFEFDALDRLIDDVTPKLSAEGSYINRTYAYDDNDNLLERIDGAGQSWEASYTPMDLTAEDESPPSQHVDETGSAGERTQFRYDDEENVVKLISPKGVETATVDDFTTEYRYDELGRPVAEIRLAPGQDPDRLATSYAYDRRDNLVGMVDPRHNADGGDPVANALDPAKRRFTFVYDNADRQIKEIEDPDGEALITAYGYDANGNLTATTDPRGTPPGDDPSFSYCLAASFTRCLRYDKRDLLVEEADGEDRRTAIDRRADGRVVGLTSPKGTASAAAGDFRTGFSYFPTGELRERTIPHAQNQYGSNSLKVEYDINQVGDPVAITDAAGRQIVNTFMDGGELRTTNRPSWWTYDGTQVRERTPEEMGGSPEEAQLPDSEGHGDLGSVGDQGMPAVLPRAGNTRFDYDGELRVTAVHDVAGKLVRLDRDSLGRLSEMRRPIDATRDYVVKYGYDFNSNLRRVTDPEGHNTTFAVDQFDRVISETRPGSTGDGPDATTFTLDPNGNTTGVETPRGTDWLMTFDAMDRILSERHPEGGTTTWEYDRAGNRIRETSPRGNALPEVERGPFQTHREFNAVNEVTTRTDGLGHEWRFEYDLNGNRTKIDAPPIARNPDAAEHRQVTTRTFEGRDLLWTETTGSNDNGNDCARTRVFEFDPNRQLRRVVNPKGVGGNGLPTFTYTADSQVSSNPEAAKHATVYEYEDGDDPTLLTSVRLPWGDRDADDQKRYRQRFAHDDRGRVSAIDPPFDGPDAPAAARTTYTHFDTGWIRRATDNWQRFDYDYDKRGLQTSWKVTETNPATNKTREIGRLYWPSGALRERSGQKDLGQGTQPEYTYAYEYNRNGLLTLLDDQRKDRETRFSYDGADRMTDANESAFLVGEETRRGKDTRLAYDLDGNVVTRRTDGRIQSDGTYAGGKLAEFEFDSLGREQKMTVTADGEATRRTFSDFWPGGELRSRRTERSSSANDTVQRWFRFSDGRLSRLDRKRQGAADFAKNQAYDYDLNGNRIQDERGTHAFNSRDQLVRWTKNGGSQVDYVLNGSGAVTSRTEGDTSTSYHYLPGGERLSHAIVTQGGTSSRTDYSYSQGFGDITSYRVEGAAEPTAEFTYDAFGRVTRSKRGSNQELYSYDGLDRRDTKMADGREFDLSYVGLSEALSQEQQFGGDERRTYDYNSVMQRLGTARRTSPTQTAPYRAYSTDAAGSVEGLEDDNGEIIGQRYAYDPYGAQLSAESGLSGEAQANPFRFQGHYYDPAQQTYDMRARAYLPELGRFLQEDHFEQATGDYLLEADPLTQDRYAFLGGNPVGFVEFDGHYAGTSDQRSGTIQTQGGNVVDREKGRTVAGPQASPGPDRSGFEQPLGAPQQSGDAPLTDVSSTRDPYSRRGAAAPPPGHRPCRIPTSGPADGSQLACGPPEAGTLFGLSMNRCLATQSGGASRSYCTGWQGAQRVTPEQYLAPFAPLTGEFAFAARALQTGARVAPQAAETAAGALRNLRTRLADETGSIPAKAATGVRKASDEVPSNLPEQLAMESAKSGYGRVIIRDLGDEPRLISQYGAGEWVKMQNVARGLNQNVTVHWFRNLTTGANVEFKFTQRYYGHMKPSGVAKSKTDVWRP